MNDVQHPRRRLVATVFLVLFAAVGLLVFRGRLTHEVTLRLELPPFVLDGAGARVPREAFGRLSGQVSTPEGEAASSFGTRASESPIAGPVALRLRAGAHVAEVRLPDVAGGRTLAGRFEVHGDGEARVDLRIVD